MGQDYYYSKRSTWEQSKADHEHIEAGLEKLDEIERNIKKAYEDL